MIKLKAQNLWMVALLSLIRAIWKERNKVVFEDVAFSSNRMTLSFVSMLISWAGLVPNVECSLVRILVYSLRAGLDFWGGRVLFLPFLAVQSWRQALFWFNILLGLSFIKKKKLKVAFRF